ncbi:ribonuclease Z [Oratosquilla oratoria]|uniref:ribonuclease Z n=1 Tax=Oratosquilla oratoria TaxID=337810 RepID=UPI003F7752F4
MKTFIITGAVWHGVGSGIRHTYFNYVDQVTRHINVIFHRQLPSFCGRLNPTASSQLSRCVTVCRSYATLDKRYSRPSNLLVENCSTTVTGFITTRNKSRRRNKNKLETNEKLLQLLNTMPKKVDVKVLQEARLAKKQRIKKYPPSTVYLQVLGSGAPGAPRSLYVFTEHARYLFNCGEGCQRMAYEHKVKLSMMEHIMVTHKSWQNVGGLPGLLLTLQDTGVPEITLHGPPGIETLYFDTRHFIRFRNLNISYNHYTSNDGKFGSKEDPLSIQYVPLWATTMSNSEEEAEVKENLEVKTEAGHDTTASQVSTSAGNLNGTEECVDYYAHERGNGKRTGGDGAAVMAKRPKKEESVLTRNLAVAYICQPPPKAGALILEKCVKFGVPPGPLLGELKRGNDVTLPNGNVVRACDVTNPDDPGPVFIVVEAPSKAYLESLLASPQFLPYQSTAQSDADLAEVVVHFTSMEVVEDPRYQEWMARFSPSTQHILINDQNTCMGSEAIHRIQYKLNLLSPSLFPLLQDKSLPLKDSLDSDLLRRDSNCVLPEKAMQDNVNCGSEVNDGNKSLETSHKHITGPVTKGRTLLTYYLRPRKKLQREIGTIIDPKTYIQECYDNEGFEEALKAFKDSVGELKESSGEEHPHIVFLGTGSCIPNKTRNTSGILLNLSLDKSLLLDCGEGTYGQMVRYYGIQGADKLLQNLSAIYVSHLHADHHIGLINLLLARRKAFQKMQVSKVPPLVLLAPSRIMNYLSSYHANFEDILENISLTPNHKFLTSRQDVEKEAHKELCHTLDMKAVDMTYVEHCPNSFGVALTHTNGWKVVYSGDTMPCKGLVDIGQDCDLLIHEATMEDELLEDALIKTHSTTSQAIQIGVEMKAKHIILTHFSQRYAKVPLLSDTVPANVGIAFDNMKVGLQDLPNLHYLYPAMVAMFAEDYDEMLDKTAKKKAARALAQKEELEVEMLDKTTKKALAQNVDLDAELSKTEKKAVQASMQKELDGETRGKGLGS